LSPKGNLGHPSDSTANQPLARDADNQQPSEPNQPAAIEPVKLRRPPVSRFTGLEDSDSDLSCARNDRNCSAVDETNAGSAVSNRPDTSLLPNCPKRELDAARSLPIIRPMLHHVGLKTARLEPMVDWHKTVLGMEPCYQSASAAGTKADCRCATVWLGNDAANHRIALTTLRGLAEDAQRSRHTGLHHLAFAVPALDDLLMTFRRLKALGIEPVHAADHGPTTSFYYEDPDGNTIELMVDNFGDERRSRAFMENSAEFAGNPMGADADPEQIFAAHAAGVSVAEVHQRAYAGEYRSARGFYQQWLAAAASRKSAG
jgi:catechol 2,3-dioxygenase